MVSNETDSTAPPAFDYNQFQFGFVGRDTKLDFQSLLSTKTTVADVARDIYTFDPRLSLSKTSRFSVSSSATNIIHGQRTLFLRSIASRLHGR